MTQRDILNIAVSSFLEGDDIYEVVLNAIRSENDECAKISDRYSEDDITKEIRERENTP